MSAAQSQRHLTEHELKCLEKFAAFEMSIEQLRSCLRTVLKFDFCEEVHGGRRWLEAEFVVPEPGIPITMKDVRDAIAKRKDKKITRKQLVDWATMLLMNDAFEFDGIEEDLIAQSLNDISVGCPPGED